ncbi:hypothetical protein AGMMS49991_03780 [Spirochaetia bacterium]|nr:hypothetical protein AGMMS49991_03780 [Spirochaetia bacterium]
MKKGKWLILAVLAFVLVLGLTTCNMGLDEQPGLWLDGEKIIHHHDTAVKTLTFEVGTTNYYEGGHDKLPAGGISFVDPGTGYLGVPIKAVIDRLYGNGLITNANNGTRTGNDPSAKYTDLADEGGEKRAEITLCKQTLILKADGTTYTADGAKVEYGLQPMNVGGVIFVNAKGIQTWIPCNAVVDHEPGSDSKITGAKGTEMIAVGILATHLPMPPTRTPSPDGIEMGNMTAQSIQWYRTKRALEIADNLLDFQRLSGGWYKNTDMVNLYGVTDDDRENGYSSLDNNATYPQIQYLAQIISAGSTEQKYLAAFYRGIAFLLRSQYPTGGWPQYAEPIRAGYYANITFNDDAMIGVMELLEGILNNAWWAGFVQKDTELINQVRAARDLGIECILNAQQRTADGKLAIWCQQHDPVTLQPVDARAYELPLLAPMESSPITSYLMTIKNPGPRITEAIESAVEWFKRTAQVGYITDRVYDQKMLCGDVREIFYTGNPRDMIWGRFYDLETGLQDVYTTRDGIKRYFFHEINYTTRHGYMFIHNRGMQVLVDYEIWKQRKPDKNFPMER